MICHICNNASMLFEVGTVLSKYRVEYFQCGSCGFIQTEDPYWLDEAYSSALARTDVGAIARNEYNASITTVLLRMLFPKAKTSMDFGAAHGVFVRMMRNRGFDFYWMDKYAPNLYALGFESTDGKVHDFLTAFEVLEHLANPMPDIEEMMKRAENVFVSTVLLPTPAPGLGDWWYYAPYMGQHISFYTLESLQMIAARYDRHLLSLGPYHLFSKEPKSSLSYRIALSGRFAKIASILMKRPSLVPSDHESAIRSLKLS